MHAKRTQRENASLSCETFCCFHLSQLRSAVGFVRSHKQFRQLRKAERLPSAAADAALATAAGRVQEEHRSVTKMAPPASAPADMETRHLMAFAAKSAETFVSAYYAAADGPGRNKVGHRSGAQSPDVEETLMCSRLLSSCPPSTSPTLPSSGTATPSREVENSRQCYKVCQYQSTIFSHSTVTR